MSSLLQPGPSPDAQAAAAVTYVSFDGRTSLATRYLRPDRYRFWHASSIPTPTIARGAGLSYVAASFGRASVSIDHGAFNRVLDFDTKTGALEVEAGINLGAVYDFLAPRHLYLPVQPGHPAITVGGCVAADVHGKNQQRDGTFVATVKSLKLFHPRHGILSLSREQDPDLFYLTCGGYGLTGNILSVVLQPKRLPSKVIEIVRVPLADAASLGNILRQAVERADLVYTWHNLTARGSEFARGYVYEGRFVDTANQAIKKLNQEAPQESSGQQLASERIVTKSSPHPHLDAAGRGALRLPFFSEATTRPFNAAYDLAQRFSGAKRQVALYDFMFPVHNKQIYFKLFGKPGFGEYQVVIPEAAFGDFMGRLKHHLSLQPLAITLASGKLFGGEGDLLRFQRPGVCLALDYPKSTKSDAFAAFLDETMLALGGIPNLIKDSRLTADVVARAFGDGYTEFRRRLRQFDPDRVYQSELSQRLDL